MQDTIPDKVHHADAAAETRPVSPGHSSSGTVPASPVQSTLPVGPGAPEDPFYEPQHVHKKWKHKKLVLIPLLILIILGAVGYYTGKYLTDPSRTVDTFRSAVKAQNVRQLKGIVGTNDNTTVTDTQVRAMLRLFKQNPELYSSILDSLNRSAESIHHKRSGDTLYYLQKDGKSFLFFDRYRIGTTAVHPRITTNLKGMSVGIKDVGTEKKAVKADGDQPQTLVMDGVIPGIYTFYGKADRMNSSKTATVTKPRTEIDFSGIFIPVASNIAGAELYVDGKDTGQTVKEAGVWGPFKHGATPTFSAKYTVGGKSIESAEVSISDDDNYDSISLEDAESEGVNLVFEAAESADFYSLDADDKDAVKEKLNDYFGNYFNATSNAVSNDDTEDFISYFVAGSDFFKEQLQTVKKFNDDGVEESVKDYTIGDFKKIGENLYSVPVDEDWDETIYSDDGDEKEKEITYTSTYQLKETAPGELKIVDVKIANRQVQDLSDVGSEDDSNEF